MTGLKLFHFFVLCFIAPRVNHAPRAEIHPKETTITLPTHAVVLDGSSKLIQVFLAQILSLKYDILLWENLV